MEIRIGNETAVFAGGCFWCTEAVFKGLKGVVSVTPGYAGGAEKDPTYEEVSSGRTGHAEAIRIEYDPAVIDYGSLLAVFFATHDPTTPNRQGNDVGTEYRSAIFYADERQKEAAESYIKELNGSTVGGAPVVTEVAPFTGFYEAEDYHKNYYERNGSAPYCQIVIEPKLEKARRMFAELLKKGE